MIAERLDKLRVGMAERGIDAFLSLKLVNTYYLSGFTSLDTARPTTYTRPIAVVVDGDGSCLIVPVLDEEAAGESSEISDVRCYAGSPAMRAARELVFERLREVGATRVGVEQDTLTAEWIGFFREHAPEIELVFAGDLVARQRMIKDAQEVELIRRAGAMSDAAIRAAITASRPGVAEVVAETSGVVALREAAAAGDEGTIVDAIPMLLAGPRSSMPHEFTTGRPIGAGEVMWHCWLVSYRGYWAENIRTAVAAPDSAPFDEAYGVLHESLLAGQARATVGSTAHDVYHAVMDVLHGAKLPGSVILNRSGHGMGLEYHEPPFIEDGDDTALEPGMVITVEPGIWFPGTGGLALSNTLLVTENGPELLTTTPEHLHRTC